MREDEEDDEFESWVYMFDDSDGASSEYDNVSSYIKSPTHTLGLNYSYVTAELFIHYGWVYNFYNFIVLGLELQIWEEIKVLILFSND